MRFAPGPPRTPRDTPFGDRRGLRTFAGLFVGLFVGLVLVAGSAAITWGSLAYFGDDLAPFVIERLPLPHEDLWIFVLQAHVAVVAFALPACVALLSTALVRRAPQFHRWLGRLSGLAILGVLVPSGLYLALFAKFSWPSTAGFVLSGAIVAVAMAQAIRTARAGRYAEHRRWALHVLAQLSVAVTSRAMLVGCDALGVEPRLAYLVSLWLPVVGSALVVQLVASRTRTARPHRRSHEVLAADPDPLRRSFAARAAGG